MVGVLIGLGVITLLYRKDIFPKKEKPTFIYGTVDIKNMFNFKESDRTPTIRELEKKYKTKFIDNKFPFGEADHCCCTDHYISDFISHRHKYHHMPVKDIMNELDEFMAEIFERHMKQDEGLK
jgi:hypothetical protein